MSGEAGEYVFDATTQSWIKGTIGAEYVWNESTQAWGFGPGGEYLWNATTYAWDKVTTRAGGPYYWSDTDGWVKNTAIGATGNDLLLETGDHLLMETGDAILMET